MKIALAIPTHLKTVPMGKYCEQALTELGHEVALFDFSTTRSERLMDKILPARDEEKTHMNRRLRKFIERERPELFITLFGFDLSRQSMNYIRQRSIPSACWWINDPFQFQRARDKAANYDFLFSNSAVSTQQYREAGIEAYFLPQACQPDVHHSVPVQEQYRCAVSFSGDWSEDREALMTELASEFDVKVFGPWKKKLADDSPLQRVLVDGFFTPQAMVAMFSSAQIVINLHTWRREFDHGVNPRLFEAAGCGAFQLVDWKQEIPELFDTHRELRCYRDIDEVRDIARDCLQDAGQLADYAKAAQQRAYAEHTYRHRMASLLAHMGVPTVVDTDVQ